MRRGIEPPLNAAVHTTFDTSRWLLGDEQIVEVEAFGMRGTSFAEGTPELGFGAKTGDGFDSAVALMKSESGVIIKALQSYGFRRPPPELSRPLRHAGMLRRRAAQRGRIRIRSPSPPVPEYRGIGRWLDGTASCNGIRTRSPGAEFDMMLDFFDAIVRDRRPLIDAVQAARSCAPAICGEQAAAQGARVQVPQFP